MATLYSPKIVTDGLALCLDAGNRKSYPSSGTTWNDLSGNGNTGTLVNGPTYTGSFGGSIVFDGTNDYVSTTSSYSLSSATFVAWINSSTTQPQYSGIIFSRNALSNASAMSFQTGNVLGYHWNNDANTYNWNSGLVVPNNSWSMVAVSISPASASAYIYNASGVFSATNILSHLLVSNLNFDIGRDPYVSGGNRYFTGRISTAAVYSRSLNSSEVLQNYNATKARFGL